jgi:hypothetical protein
VTGFVVKDSGERRTFATGSVRDRGDLKPRPDLISPFAMMRVGEGYIVNRDAVRRFRCRFKVIEGQAATLSNPAQAATRHLRRCRQPPLWHIGCRK